MKWCRNGEVAGGYMWRLFVPGKDGIDLNKQEFDLEALLTTPAVSKDVEETKEQQKVK